MKLFGLFNRFSPSKVLVVGDLILDDYTFGKVKRISPEAPVPIVRVEKSEEKPGGAANVALNLASLGCEVYISGRIGEDDSGRKIVAMLQASGINTSGIVVEKGFQTPTKRRVIADRQQLMRLDYEEVKEISPKTQKELNDFFIDRASLLDVVAVSDYGKGLLTPSLLQQLIQSARHQEIPVIVDPKGLDFSRYAGATILKPNRSEAYAASGLSEEASLLDVCKVIFSQVSIKTLLVTLAGDGMAAYEEAGQLLHFPQHGAKELVDVTGAGDTVLAFLTAGIGCGFTLAEAAEFSNSAAAIAVERLGCAVVTLSDLAHRALMYNVENKVYDEQHFFALRQALGGKECAVLEIESDEGISKELFESLRSLKMNYYRDLIVYIKNENPSESFVRLLASLPEVNFIIIEQESFQKFSAMIGPTVRYVFKGGVHERV